MARFFDPQGEGDGRLFAPATQRNRDVIRDALVDLLAVRPAGTLLEVACGSGEHATHIAPALSGWRWQPSDIEEAHLNSVNAWNAHLETDLPPAIHLDVTADPWPIHKVDAIFSANLIHIAPQTVTEHLLRGASVHLNPGGLLIIYGPFRIAGNHTAESNAAFDEKLKSNDPSWGIRCIDEITQQAVPLGLTPIERRSMPANNFVMVFERNR